MFKHSLVATYPCEVSVGFPLPICLSNIVWKTGTDFQSDSSQGCMAEDAEHTLPPPQSLSPRPQPCANSNCPSRQYLPCEVSEQYLLHLRQKEFTIDRPINHHRCCQSVMPQCRHKCCRLPVSMRNMVDHSFADLCPTIKWSHVRFRPSFVDEDESFEVNDFLELLPFCSFIALAVKIS